MLISVRTCVGDQGWEGKSKRRGGYNTGSMDNDTSPVHEILKDACTSSHDTSVTPVTI